MLYEVYVKLYKRQNYSYQKQNSGCWGWSWGQVIGYKEA